MKGLANSLEERLQDIGQKKLWVVVSSLALAAFYSGSNFVTSLHDVTVEHQRRVLIALQRSQDLQNILKVRGEILGSGSTLQKSIKDLSEVVDTLEPTGPQSYDVNLQTTTTAYVNVMKARSDITSVLAVLKGSTLKTPELADLFKGFDTDFRDIHDGFTEYQLFYTSLLKHDPFNVLDAENRIMTVQMKVGEAAKALSQRTAEMLPHLERASMALENERSRQNQNILLLVLKGILTTTLVGLTVFLSVLLYKSSISSSRSN